MGNVRDNEDGLHHPCIKEVSRSAEECYYNSGSFRSFSDPSTVARSADFDKVVFPHSNRFLQTGARICKYIYVTIASFSLEIYMFIRKLIKPANFTIISIIALISSFLLLSFIIYEFFSSYSNRVNLSRTVFYKGTKGDRHYGNNGVDALFASHLEYVDHPYYSKKSSKDSRCKIGVVTSFPPERCGIAQFSEHLIQGIKASMNATDDVQCQISVLALHDHSASTFFRTYDLNLVEYIIDLDDNLPSKAVFLAAEYIIQNEFSTILFQHEFGLTPIMWQQLDLVRWLIDETAQSKINIFSTVHTPRAHPTNEEREFIYQLGRIVDKLVVMSYYSQYSLIHAYDVEPEKILMIPHAVKDIYLEMDIATYPFDKSDNEPLIILSNGLIHQHKGYDRMIRNLPALIKKFPNLLFCIIGQEHAKNKNHGYIMKGYQELAASLGVEKHIVWENVYVTDTELVSYFKKTDIYITLYDEITPVSGTLTTAMAAGLPILSTPYLYAQEILGKGLAGNYKNDISDLRGIVLSDFDNDNEIVEAFSLFLSSPDLRRRCGEAARNHVKNWTWNSIGRSYFTLFQGYPIIDIEKPSDPYLDYKIQNTASWHHFKLSSFDGSNLFESSGSKVSSKFYREFYQISMAFGDGYPIGVPLPSSAVFSDDVYENSWKSKLRTFIPFLSRDIPVSSAVIVPFQGSELSSLIIALYIDVDVQVNAVVASDMTLIAVGIFSRLGWFYIHRNYGLDIELFAKKLPETILVDLDENSVELTCKNVLIKIYLKDNIIYTRFENANPFSSPKGLLGESLRWKYDMSLNSAQKTKNKLFKQQTTWRYFSDASFIQSMNWNNWLVRQGFLFSSETPSQIWTGFGIVSNIFKPYPNASDFLKGFKISKMASPVSIKDASPFNVDTIPVLTVQLEGSFFDYSGFSTVNRQLYSQLIKENFRSSRRIFVKVLATDLSSKSSTTSLLERFYNMSPRRTLQYDIKLDSILKILLWENYISPYVDMATHAVHSFTEPDIVFRNSWLAEGPDFSLPTDSAGSPSKCIPNMYPYTKTFLLRQRNIYSTSKLVHQQPWEFGGIPKEWIHCLHHSIDRLWVPSLCNSMDYQDAGIKKSKINVIPHGVDAFKMNLIKNVLEFNTSSNDIVPFRFLFTGGLLPRKGVDILLNAFLEMFSEVDNVQLVLHSTYGDDFYLKEIQAAVKQFPDKIIFLQKDKNWKSMIQLYRSCSIYISPYRSEGFGLMILEAMAVGLPVMITDAGPAKEFTTIDCAYYIPTQENMPCMQKPCGNGTVFSHPTTKQPSWHEPSTSGLAELMRKVYREKDSSTFQQMSAAAMEQALKWTWDRVGQLMIDEFENLALEDNGPVRFRSS